MARRDEMDNQARSEDARTFSLVAQIPEPQDDDTLYIEPRADFPFDIIEIFTFVTSGDVEITPLIDGVAVDTDGTDSSGTILVDQPSGVTFTPDGSTSEVGSLQALTVAITNPSSDVGQLIIKFKCRRTEENVVVT